MKVVFRGRLGSADLFRRLVEVYSKCGCTILYLEIGESCVFVTNYVEGEGTVVMSLRMDASVDFSEYIFGGEKACVGVTVSYALEILKNCSKSDKLGLSLLEDSSGILLSFTIPGKRMTEENRLHVSRVPEMSSRIPVPRGSAVSICAEDFKKIHKKMNKSSRNRFVVERRDNSILMYKDTEGVYSTKLEFRDCSHRSGGLMQQHSATAPVSPTGSAASAEGRDCKMVCSANVFASLEKIISQGSLVSFFIEKADDSVLLPPPPLTETTGAVDDDSLSVYSCLDNIESDDDDEHSGSAMMPLVLSTSIKCLGKLDVCIQQ